jgi:hypothetical protein
MRSYEVIMLICGCIGMCIYFFGLLLPMKRASAARGQPWRMVPVCWLGDYFDRVIARKHAEKDRLLALARQRSVPPTPPMQGSTPRATLSNPLAKRAPLPPPVFIRAKKIPEYYGRISVSNVGPAGELFVFLETMLTDDSGMQHTEVATNVVIPQEALPFIDQCIRDQRMLVVRAFPTNEHEIRLKIDVENADGRMMRMREWILEQALVWRPFPQVYATTPATPLRSPLLATPIPPQHRAACN